jgi:hypothetical protein
VNKRPNVNWIERKELRVATRKFGVRFVASVVLALAVLGASLALQGGDRAEPHRVTVASPMKMEW